MKYQNETDQIKEIAKKPSGNVAPSIGPTFEGNVLPETSVSPVKTPTASVKRPKEVSGEMVLQEPEKLPSQAPEKKVEAPTLSVASMNQLEAELTQKKIDGIKNTSSGIYNMATTEGKGDKVFIDPYHYVLVTEQDKAEYKNYLDANTAHYDENGNWIVPQQPDYNGSPQQVEQYSGIVDYVMRSKKATVYLDEKQKYDYIKNTDPEQIRQKIASGDLSDLTYKERTLRDFLDTAVKEGTLNMTADEAEQIFSQVGTMEILDLKNGYFSVSKDTYDKLGSNQEFVRQYNTLLAEGKNSDAQDLLLKAVENDAMPIVVQNFPINTYFEHPQWIGVKQRLEGWDYWAKSAENFADYFVKGMTDAGIDFNKGVFFAQPMFENAGAVIFNFVSKMIDDKVKETYDFLDRAGLDDNAMAMLEKARTDSFNTYLIDYTNDILERNAKESDLRSKRLAMKYMKYTPDSMISFADDAGQSIGYMTPVILMSLLTMGADKLAQGLSYLPKVSEFLTVSQASAQASGLGAMGVNIMSNTYGRDIYNGVDYKTAMIHAMAVTAVETWTETFNPTINGVPANFLELLKKPVGQTAVDATERVLLSSVQSGPMRFFTDLVIGMGEEGTEELISQVFSKALDNIVKYDLGVQKGGSVDWIDYLGATMYDTFNMFTTSEGQAELANSYFMGAVTAGIMSGIKFVPYTYQNISDTLGEPATLNMSNKMLDYALKASQKINLAFPDIAPIKGFTVGKLALKFSNDSGEVVYEVLNDKNLKAVDIESVIKNYEGKGYTLSQTSLGENVPTFEVVTNEDGTTSKKFTGYHIYASNFAVSITDQVNSNGKKVIKIEQGNKTVLQTAIHEILHTKIRENIVGKNNKPNRFFNEMIDRYATKLFPMDDLVAKHIQKKEFVYEADENGEYTIAPDYVKGQISRYFGTDKVYVGTLEHGVLAKIALSEEYRDRMIDNRMFEVPLSSILEELSVDFHATLYSRKPVLLSDLIAGEKVKGNNNLSTFYTNALVKSYNTAKLTELKENVNTGEAYSRHSNIIDVAKAGLDELLVGRNEAINNSASVWATHDKQYDDAKKNIENQTRKLSDSEKLARDVYKKINKKVVGQTNKVFFTNRSVSEISKKAGTTKRILIESNGVEVDPTFNTVNPYSISLFDVKDTLLSDFTFNDDQNALLQGVKVGTELELKGELNTARDLVYMLENANTVATDYMLNPKITVENINGDIFVKVTANTNRNNLLRMTTFINGFEVHNNITGENINSNKVIFRNYNDTEVSDKAQKAYSKSIIDTLPKPDTQTKADRYLLDNKNILSNSNASLKALKWLLESHVNIDADIVLSDPKTLFNNIDKMASVVGKLSNEINDLSITDQNRDYGDLIKELRSIFSEEAQRNLYSIYQIPEIDDYMTSLNQSIRSIENIQNINDRTDEARLQAIETQDEMDKLLKTENYKTLYDDSRHPGFYSELRNTIIKKMAPKTTVFELKSIVKQVPSYESKYYLAPYLNQFNDNDMVNKEDVLRYVYTHEPKIEQKLTPPNQEQYGGYMWSKTNYRTLQFYAFSDYIGHQRQAHFGPNHVSHILTTEAYDIGGNENILLEETQSDVHEAGEKYGYRDPLEGDTLEIMKRNIVSKMNEVRSDISFDFKELVNGKKAFVLERGQNVYNRNGWRDNFGVKFYEGQDGYSKFVNKVNFANYERIFSSGNLQNTTNMRFVIENLPVRDRIDTFQNFAHNDNRFYGDMYGSDDVYTLIKKQTGLSFEPELIDLNPAILNLIENGFKPSNRIEEAILKSLEYSVSDFKRYLDKQKKGDPNYEGNVVRLREIMADNVNYEKYYKLYNQINNDADVYSTNTGVMEKGGIETETGFTLDNNIGRLRLMLNNMKFEPTTIFFADNLVVETDPETGEVTQDFEYKTIEIKKTQISGLNVTTYTGGMLDFLIETQSDIVVKDKQQAVQQGTNSIKQVFRVIINVNETKNYVPFDKFVRQMISRDIDPIPEAIQYDNYRDGFYGKATRIIGVQSFQLNEKEYLDYLDDKMGTIFEIGRMFDSIRSAVSGAGSKVAPMPFMDDGWKANNVDQFIKLAVKLNKQRAYLSPGLAPALRWGPGDRGVVYSDFRIREVDVREFTGVSGLTSREQDTLLRMVENMKKQLPQITQADTTEVLTLDQIKQNLIGKKAKTNANLIANDLMKEGVLSKADRFNKVEQLTMIEETKLRNDNSINIEAEGLFNEQQKKIEAVNKENALIQQTTDFLNNAKTNKKYRYIVRLNYLGNSTRGANDEIFDLTLIDDGRYLKNGDTSMFLEYYKAMSKNNLSDHQKPKESIKKIIDDGLANMIRTIGDAVSPAGNQYNILTPLNTEYKSFGEFFTTNAERYNGMFTQYDRANVSELKKIAKKTNAKIGTEYISNEPIVDTSDLESHKALISRYIVPEMENLVKNIFGFNLTSVPMDQYEFNKNVVNVKAKKHHTFYSLVSGTDFFREGFSAVQKQLDMLGTKEKSPVLHYLETSPVVKGMIENDFSNDMRRYRDKDYVDVSPVVAFGVLTRAIQTSSGQYKSSTQQLKKQQADEKKMYDDLNSRLRGKLPDFDGKEMSVKEIFHKVLSKGGSFMDTVHVYGYTPVRRYVFKDYSEIIESIVDPFFNTNYPALSYNYSNKFVGLLQDVMLTIGTSTDRTRQNIHYHVNGSTEQYKRRLDYLKSLTSKATLSESEKELRDRYISEMNMIKGNLSQRVLGSTEGYEKYLFRTQDGVMANLYQLLPYLNYSNVNGEVLMNIPKINSHVTDTMKRYKDNFLEASHSNPITQITRIIRRTGDDFEMYITGLYEALNVMRLARSYYDNLESFTTLFEDASNKSDIKNYYREHYKEALKNIDVVLKKLNDEYTAVLPLATSVKVAINVVNNANFETMFDILDSVRGARYASRKVDLLKQLNTDEQLSDNKKLMIGYENGLIRAYYLEINDEVKKQFGPDSKFPIYQAIEASDLSNVSIMKVLSIYDELDKEERLVQSYKTEVPSLIIKEAVKNSETIRSIFENSIGNKKTLTKDEVLQILEVVKTDFPKYDVNKLKSKLFSLFTSEKVQAGTLRARDIQKTIYSNFQYHDQAKWSGLLDYINEIVKQDPNEMMSVAELKEAFSNDIPQIIVKETKTSDPFGRFPRYFGLSSGSMGTTANFPGLETTGGVYADLAFSTNPGSILAIKDIHFPHIDNYIGHARMTYGVNWYTKSGSNAKASVIEEIQSPYDDSVIAKRGTEAEAEANRYAKEFNKVLDDYRESVFTKVDNESDPMARVMVFENDKRFYQIDAQDYVNTQMGETFRATNRNVVSTENDVNYVVYDVNNANGEFVKNIYVTEYTDKMAMLMAIDNKLVNDLTSSLPADTLEQQKLRNATQDTGLFNHQTQNPLINNMYFIDAPKVELPYTSLFSKYVFKKLFEDAVARGDKMLLLTTGVGQAKRYVGTSTNAFNEVIGSKAVVRVNNGRLYIEIYSTTIKNGKFINKQLSYDFDAEAFVSGKKAPVKDVTLETEAGKNMPKLQDYWEIKENLNSDELASIKTFVSYAMDPEKASIINTLTDDGVLTLDIIRNKSLDQTPIESKSDWASTERAIKISELLNSSQKNSPLGKLSKLVYQSGYNASTYPKVRSGNYYNFETITKDVPSWKLRGELISIRFNGLSNTYDNRYINQVVDQYSAFNVKPSFVWISIDTENKFTELKNELMSNDSTLSNQIRKLNFSDPSLVDRYEELRTAVLEKKFVSDRFRSKFDEMGVFVRELTQYLDNDLTEDDYQNHLYDYAKGYTHGVFMTKLPITPAMEASLNAYKSSVEVVNAEANAIETLTVSETPETDITILDTTGPEVEVKEIDTEQGNALDLIEQEKAKNKYSHLSDVDIMFVDVTKDGNPFKNIIEKHNALKLNQSFSAVVNDESKFNVVDVENVYNERIMASMNDTKPKSDGTIHNKKGAIVSRISFKKVKLETNIDRLTYLVSKASLVTGLKKSTTSGLLEQNIKHVRDQRLLGMISLVLGVEELSDKAIRIEYLQNKGKVEVDGKDRIQKVNKDGNKVWVNSKSDIYMGKTGKYAFEIRSGIFEGQYVDTTFTFLNHNSIEVLYGLDEPRLIEMGKNNNNISIKMSTEIFEAYVLEREKLLNKYPTLFNDYNRQAIVSLRSTFDAVAKIDPITGLRPKYVSVALSNLNQALEVDDTSLMDETDNIVQKDRKHEKTIIASGEVEQSTIDTVEKQLKKGMFRYTPMSDKNSLDYAVNVIANDLDKAYQDFESAFRSNRRMTKNDIAIAEMLIAEMSKENAQVKSKNKKIMNLISDLATLGTEMGQSVQALSLINKLSAEGQWLHIRRLLDRMERQALDSGKPIKFEVPETMVEDLLSKKNPAEIQVEVEKIKQEIVKQMPSTVWDKLNAWRYLSMLGNPKTHIRNFTGNLLMLPLIRSKDAISMMLEQTLPKSERTKSLTYSKELKELAKKDFIENRATIQGESKYGTLASELQRNKRVFNSNLLNTLSEKNTQLLDLSDMLFNNVHYVHAFAGFLSARGLTAETATPDDIAKARAYSVNEAQKGTFRDASELANELNYIGRKYKGVGLVLSAVVPFKKTPINIVKRVFEYSPIGLINSVRRAGVELYRNQKTSAEVINDLSAGLTGTGVMLLGLFLQSIGFLSVGSGDDDSNKKKQFFNIVGPQKYSFVVGDHSYTIDWAVPASMPLIVGAELGKYMDDENSGSLFNVLPEVLVNTFDPIFELTMLRGIKDTLTSFSSSGATLAGEAIATMTESYLGQYIPTIFGQIARIVDPVRRTTYAPKDSEFNATAESILRKLINKVPFLSTLNQPYINAFGEYEQNTEAKNLLESVFYNMFSVGYYKNIEATSEEETILNMYNKTLSEDVLPKLTPKTLTINGEQKVLTSLQRTDFGVQMGTMSKTLVKEFSQSSNYSSLSTDEKVEVFSKIYDYAYKSSVEKIFYNTDKWYAKVRDGQKQVRLTPTNYFTAEILYNKVVATDNKTKEYAYIDALHFMGLDVSQIEYMLVAKNYKVSEKDHAYIVARKEQ